jgi:hypothetical protein
MAPNQRDSKLFSLPQNALQYLLFYKLACLQFCLSNFVQLVANALLTPANLPFIKEVINLGIPTVQAEGQNSVLSHFLRSETLSGMHIVTGLVTALWGEDSKPLYLKNA